jgi:predicted phosphoribosyltransferase
VIIVDDGLATGSTMQAAIRALREKQPRKIVVAAPVAAAETCAKLRPLVDQVICVRTPDPFVAVGLWYEDFSETTDAEIHEILAAAGSPSAAGTIQGGVR